MGIFDRFRSTGHAVANSGERNADTSGQDATRLIDAGHVLEPAPRLEHMPCVDQTCRVLPGGVRITLTAVRDSMSGGAKSIEYSHLTAFTSVHAGFSCCA